jgi:hypothetical protein
MIHNPHNYFMVITLTHAVCEKQARCLLDNTVILIYNISHIKPKPHMKTQIPLTNNPNVLRPRELSTPLLGGPE